MTLYSIRGVCADVYTSCYLSMHEYLSFYNNHYSFAEPANIAVYPSTVSDYFGAEVIVQCFASGNPLPTVNWYKDGILLSTNGKIVIVETSLSNTNISKELTISSLKLSHEGTYTCFGSNTLPNGTVSDSKPISVVVQGSKLNIYLHLIQ